MNNILLSLIHIHLTYRTSTCDGDYPSTSDRRAAPMSETLNRSIYILLASTIIGAPHTSLRFKCGFTTRFSPVHARRLLPVSIQSLVPSRWTTASELDDGLVEISAVTGVVDETFWYKKGTRSATRRKGSRIDKVEVT